MFKLKENIRLTRKDKLFYYLIRLNYGIKNHTLTTLQKLLFSNRNIKIARRILIFRTGSIGDSVCAIPAINNIRKNYPDAKIDVLTNTGKLELKNTGLKAIIDETIIDLIIDYNGINFKELRYKIKRNKYDLLIQLPSSLTSFRRELKNLFLFKLLNFKSAMGFEITRVKILPKLQEKLFNFENERDRLLKMLERYGIRNYGIFFPLKKDQDVISKVKDMLSQNGLWNKERNICFVIGAKRAQNRWPINYFNEVATYLQNKNFNIIIIGNSQDREEASKINGDKVFNFCNELSLSESAELLRQCKFTISNDTGPMHLSYAVGTPVIAIFSSWQQPGLWEPPKDGRNIILRNYDVHCRMCLIENCPDNICMQSIKPEFVIDAIKKISDENIK